MAGSHQALVSSKLSQALGLEADRTNEASCGLCHAKSRLIDRKEPARADRPTLIPPQAPLKRCSSQVRVPPLQIHVNFYRNLLLGNGAFWNQCESRETQAQFGLWVAMKLANALPLRPDRINLQPCGQSPPCLLGGTLPPKRKQPRIPRAVHRNASWRWNAAIDQDSQANLFGEVGLTK